VKGTVSGIAVQVFALVRAAVPEDCKNLCFITSFGLHNDPASNQEADIYRPLQL